MPIYEYQCDGCNAVFEVFQKVSDPAPDKHACGSDKVHRILSNTSFVLKGTGWYATDYVKKEKKPHDEGGSKASKKAEGGSDQAKSSEPKTKADPAASAPTTTAKSADKSGGRNSPKDGGAATS